MLKSGLKILFEGAIKDYISEEGLEQLTILMNVKTNFKGQRQSRLSSHVEQALCVKKWLKDLIWGTLKVGISEEGLQQIAIFPEF